MHLVITDAEKLHPPYNLIPSHASGMTFIINAPARTNRLNCSFLGPELLHDNRHNSLELKPAHPCSPRVAFQLGVALQVSLCVRPSVALLWHSLSYHCCQQQTRVCHVNPQVEGHHLEIAQISTFHRFGGSVIVVKHDPPPSKHFTVKQHVVQVP